MMLMFHLSLQRYITRSRRYYIIIEKSYMIHTPAYKKLEMIMKAKWQTENIVNRAKLQTPLIVIN